MNIPYGYVYRIRNKINGKTYIGQRKLSLDRRWRQYMGSGVSVKAAITKYGVDSFAKELVAYALTYDALNKLEVELILKERAVGHAEYNLHIGSPVPIGIDPFRSFTPEEKIAMFKGIVKQTKERYRKQYEEAIRGQEEIILSLYLEYKSCKKVADQLGLSVKHVNRFLKEKGISLNYQTVEGRVLNEDQKQRIADGRKNSSINFKFICQICESPFVSKSNRAKRCSDCSLLPISTSKNYVGLVRESATQLKTATCSHCQHSFEYLPTGGVRKFCSQSCFGKSNRRELPPVEVVVDLYWVELLSANEIGRGFGVSGQTIRNYMRRNGVDRREERRRS